VPHPRAGLDPGGCLADRAVGHAEQHEVCAAWIDTATAYAHAAAPLPQPGGERAADATRADDADVVDLELQFQWIPGTGSVTRNVRPLSCNTVV
jgi:hypothetical protein